MADTKKRRNRDPLAVNAKEKRYQAVTQTKNSYLGARAIYLPTPEEKALKSTRCRSAALTPRVTFPTPKIRNCEERDMETIQNIYEHYVTNSLTTMELDAPDVNEMLKRRADILGKGFPYIVAESDGVIIGYAYAGED